MGRWILLLAVLTGLTGCAEPPPAAPEAGTPVPVVLDTFEVGEDVFVRALAVEPGADRLWVGTSVGALEIDLATREALNTFTRDDVLASEYVFGIFVDAAGYKWFGTNAGGVTRYRNQDDWQVLFPRHGLADYWVYAFAQQHAGGSLWIGTWAGANRVDPGTLAFETFVDELINEWVYGIAVDSKDRLWFATEGGVSRFDGATWQHWTHADGLGAPNATALPASSNTGLGTRSRHDLGVLLRGEETYNPSYVFAIAADQNDRIWAGTWGGGVSVYDNGDWRNYVAADGLGGNIVYSIAVADDAHWFGTNRGLSRFDGRDWVTYDRAAGLADDHVYAVVITPNGEIWAGTRGGVSRLGASP